MTQEILVDGYSQAYSLNHYSRGQRRRFLIEKYSPCKGKPNHGHHSAHTPQSLQVLSARIIFSTKGRQPWLTQNICERVWMYPS